MSILRGPRPMWKRKQDIATEIIPNCPTCGKRGQVVCIPKYGIVTMMCIDCLIEWSSLTHDCPVCGEPNNYAVPGTCVACYKKRKKGAKQ